jgi:Tfp pilus assembly protein PilV
MKTKYILMLAAGLTAMAAIPAALAQKKATVEQGAAAQQQADQQAQSEADRKAQRRAAAAKAKPKAEKDGKLNGHAEEEEEQPAR